MTKQLVMIHAALEAELPVGSQVSWIYRGKGRTVSVQRGTVVGLAGMRVEVLNEKSNLSYTVSAKRLSLAGDGRE